MQQFNKQMELPDPTRIHKEGWRFSECLGVQEGIEARGTTSFATQIESYRNRSESVLLLSTCSKLLLSAPARVRKK